MLVFVAVVIIEIAFLCAFLIDFHWDPIKEAI